MKKKTILGKDLPYEAWLKEFLNDVDNKIFPHNSFPSDEYKEKYLSEIQKKSDKEVKKLLRKFLPINSTYGRDVFLRKKYMGSAYNILEIIEKSEYHRRLFSTKHVWEGLTWVLDLLPSFPDECLNGIDSYFLANCQFFTDYTLDGLGDASEIISAKYINFEHPQELYLRLKYDEFEWLISELFKAMKYETLLTKKSHDKGIDIIASKNSLGHKEKVLIQCKRYSKKITVREVRELNGVVASNYSLKDEQATKGILVTSALFTKTARKEAEKNHRIELIDNKELSKLLNRYLGRYWHSKLNVIFWNYRYGNTPRSLKLQ